MRDHGGIQKNRAFSGVNRVLSGATSVGAAIDGFETLSNWNSLPLAKTGVEAGLFTSGTPGGDTYSDYNGSLGTDPNNGFAIIAAINGPGEISRLWMPHATANRGNYFHVYLNVPLSNLATTTSGATPVINTDTSTLLPAQGYGNGTQFRSPLVQTILGGSVSYEPITFSQSALVEMGGSSQPGVNYYQVGYHTFSSQAVSDFSPGSPPASRSSAVNMLNAIGSNPGGTPTQSAGVSGISVPASQAYTLANLTGSGQIGALKLSMGSSPTDAQLDGLRLRLSYDGNSAPSIDVPVSQFFGAGHGRADYQSLPMGATGGNYYCYFPMPFRNGATVQLYNSTGQPISVNSAAVQYTPGAVPATANYFHAVYQSQVTGTADSSYNMLHITGSGQYVGNILSIHNGNYSALEGNDIITVDGSHLLEGTGVEDAYNGGYYYNNSASGTVTTDHGDLANTSSGASAFSGLLSLTGGVNTDQYRWLISDYVPFSQSLDVSMQNADAGNNVSWGSTAFYYSDSAAPEPSTGVILFAAGAVGLLRRRRNASSKT